MLPKAHLIQCMVDTLIPRALAEEIVNQMYRICQITHDYDYHTLKLTFENISVTMPDPTHCPCVDCVDEFIYSATMIQNLYMSGYRAYLVDSGFLTSDGRQISFYKFTLIFFRIL